MARFKSRAPSELLFSAFSLIIFTIAVHAVYVTVVRPRADVLLAEQRAAMLKDPNYVARALAVRGDEGLGAGVRGDPRALGVRAHRLQGLARPRASASCCRATWCNVPEGMRILPEDTREYARPLEALPPAEAQCLLPRALLVALYRFGATRNIQDVSDAARGVCEGEADRLDSELSMLRYIAWAIPAIGFIGTVRGIGDALGQAHQAVSGDVSGVTEGLGTAFNSTLIALLISIVLMFLLHQLQLAQERLVLDTETYLDQYLIRHMQVR